MLIYHSQIVQVLSEQKIPNSCATSWVRYHDTINIAVRTCTAQAATGGGGKEAGRQLKQAFNDFLLFSIQLLRTNSRKLVLLMFLYLIFQTLPLRAQHLHNEHNLHTLDVELISEPLQ